MKHVPRYTLNSSLYFARDVENVYLSGFVFGGAPRPRTPINRSLARSLPCSAHADSLYRESDRIIAT